MAAPTITLKDVAFTEKKMDMSLDDIIKMTKAGTSKANNKKPRPSNKNQKPFTNSGLDQNSGKVRRYMDSRSSLRQGALAQRRITFNGNQFRKTNEYARKAASAPIHNKPFYQNRMTHNRRVAAPRVEVRVSNRGFTKKVQPKRAAQTLDSLFANMKEERMRSQQNSNNYNRQFGRGGGGQQHQKGRGRFFRFGSN